MLPTQYGGEGGCINEIMDGWANKFCDYETFFKQESNYGINEKLRPKKATKPKERRSSFEDLEYF